MKPDLMPNGKTDTNNNCAVSTDYIGMNFAYLTGPLEVPYISFFVGVGIMVAVTMMQLYLFRRRGWI